MSKLEILKKKILYRSSYRGTKEMDILLSSFSKKYLNKLDPKDLIDLDSFLSQEDELIYDIYKNKQIDKGIKEVKIAKLLIEFKI